MKKHLIIIAVLILFWALAHAKVFQASGFSIASQNIGKVFTPGVNPFPKAVYVVNNPEGDKVSGKIYDLKGELVADMKVNGDYSASKVTLEWDGAKTRKGVYIYHIESGGKVISGTVIVAK